VSRVSSVVGLASHLGRGLQRIATDATIGGIRSLPRMIGDLDAAYRSQLIGRTVSSVSVLSDWQAVHRGHPGREPAYTLISGGMGGMQAENIARQGSRLGIAALADLDTVALLEKSL
jgi:hypothetical protein